MSRRLNSVQLKLSQVNHTIYPEIYVFITPNELMFPATKHVLVSHPHKTIFQIKTTNNFPPTSSWATFATEKNILIFWGYQVFIHLKGVNFVSLSSLKCQRISFYSSTPCLVVIVKLRQPYLKSYEVFSTILFVKSQSMSTLLPPNLFLLKHEWFSGLLHSSSPTTEVHGSGFHFLSAKLLS